MKLYLIYYNSFKCWRSFQNFKLIFTTHSHGVLISVFFIRKQRFKQRFSILFLGDHFFELGVAQVSPQAHFRQFILVAERLATQRARFSDPKIAKRGTFVVFDISSGFVDLYGAPFGSISPALNAALLFLAFEGKGQNAFCPILGQTFACKDKKVEKNQFQSLADCVSFKNEYLIMGKT